MAATIQIYRCDGWHCILCEVDLFMFRPISFEIVFIADLLIYGWFWLKFVIDVYENCESSSMHYFVKLWYFGINDPKMWIDGCIIMVIVITNDESRQLINLKPLITWQSTALDQFKWSVFLNAFLWTYSS